MSSAFPALALVGLALVLSMAKPASAQMPPRPPEPDRPALPMLTVTGRGDAAVAPDEATVRMGAVAQADHAAEAQDQVSQVMQRAIEKIRALGVPAGEIQTAGLSLQPVYEPPQPGREHLPQRLVAYRASNTIQVRLDDLSRVGAVIDAAVASGANQLEGISFGLKDDTDARLRALQQAVTSARAKAKAMADAAGIQLGQVQDVTEGTVDIIRPQFEMGRAMRAMAAPAATPVEPGQVRIEATVTLRYRITPPAAMMP